MIALPLHLSNGIMVEILVEILDYFEMKNVFLQTPCGPIPFLLVDGYKTRLDTKFVDYINNSNHQWKVCLGVSYATSLWQVGDSQENNGCFKSEWYQANDSLLLWKYERELTRSIKHEDIIPLLNEVFLKAFDREDVNKRAIADCGWNPLNHKLLEHTC